MQLPVIIFTLHLRYRHAKISKNVNPLFQFSYFIVQILIFCCGVKQQSLGNAEV